MVTKSLFAGCILVLAGCSQVQSAEAPVVAENATGAGEQRTEVAFISPAELSALIADGKVVLIDVRTPEEFAEARLAGALNAPLQTFDPASIPMEALVAETGRETILYCRSSARSARAAALLAAQIKGKVRHLEGGIIAWQEAGLPVIAQP